MPRFLNTKAIVLLSAALLLLVLMYTLGGADDDSADAGNTGRADRPVSVTTAFSRSADLDVWRDIPATIAPLNQVIVRPQINGQIEQLYFEEGQMLRVGQLMATLDSRTLQAELASSEAELARIQSQFELAQAEQRRYQGLLSTQAVSQQEVAALTGQAKQLQAQLNAAKANVQAQKVRLSLTRIVAPISGRVGLRQVSIGAQVSSNDSTGIATLTQTQPISVQFGMPEQLLSAEPLQGKPIEVRAVTGDQVLAQTRISRQDSQIDPTTGSVSVRAILHNPDERFLAGQSVRVRLAEQSFRQVVTVPSRAIQQGLNQTFVYVVQDGKAQLTPITRLAQQDETSAVEGIAAGVAVVVEGQLRLKDGSTVQTADTTNQAAANEVPTSMSSAKTAQTVPSSTVTGVGR